MNARLEFNAGALVLAVALAAAPAPAQTDGEVDAEDAEVQTTWRFIDGEGVAGVLRLSDKPGPGARGFFVFRAAEHGVYEGVYNIKEDGSSAVGMFWPEGSLNSGAVSGFLDVEADGAARVSFTDGGDLDALKAR